MEHEMESKNMVHSINSFVRAKTQSISQSCLNMKQEKFM